MAGENEQGGGVKRFRDKLVMVTGGNSGIGRGIVHRFAAEGARVALVGRDPDKGRVVEGEVRDQGGEAVFFACDLTEEAAVKTLVQDVEKLGPLAIVVNNAGLGGRRTPIARDDSPGTRWRSSEAPISMPPSMSRPMPCRRSPGPAAAPSSTFPRPRLCTAIGAITASPRLPWRH